MFRKPKSRNIRVRQSNQEDAAESTDDVPTVSAPSAAAIPKNILSFDQDEGGLRLVGLEAQLGEGFESFLRNPINGQSNLSLFLGDDVGTFQIRRIESRNEHKLRRHKKFMEKHVKGETKIIGDHEEVIIKQEEDDISVIEEIEPAEKVNFQESSKNGYNDEEDVRQRFPSSFSEIPDAKAIYEARKRRELMRGSVQPVIPIENPVEDKHAQRSRLIREDENDLSDEENPEST
jgi:hypothetical protein